MSPKQFDAIVIGAGPGGYVCAIRLAQLGKKTAIIEKDRPGGVCLNVGCIPSKALIFASNQYWRIRNEYPEIGIEAPKVTHNMEKMQEWKAEVVKKLTGGVGQLLKMNGVEIFKGTATLESARKVKVTTKDGMEVIEGANIVIATGSSNFEIPSLPVNGKNILGSTEALDLRTLPKEMIVVGGGFIGVEIGTVYAKLGTKVTIVEAMDRILAAVDPELVGVVERKMKKLGMRVMTKTKAAGLKEKDPAKASTLHLDVELPDGKKETLNADVILVSVGRKPNSGGLGLEKLGVKLDPKGNIVTDSTGLTSVAGVYAIGDVNGAPQLAHRASMDGLLVAATIAGDKSHRDYKTVPWAVFCDPEIAVCGLTESEAKAKGFAVAVGKFPFAASGRALGTNETDGFVKSVVDEKTGQVLGVHIVGPEASNLIAEATLAIEMGATVADIEKVIHTHPTLPEAFPESIEAALGHAVHIYKPKGAGRAGAEARAARTTTNA